MQGVERNGSGGGRSSLGLTPFEVKRGDLSSSDKEKGWDWQGNKNGQVSWLEREWPTERAPPPAGEERCLEEGEPETAGISSLQIKALFQCKKW